MRLSTVLLFSVYQLVSVACDNIILDSQIIESWRILDAIRELQPKNIFKSMVRNKTDEQLEVNDTKCDVELKYFLEAIINFEPWALKMMDASSKISSGLLIGNMKDLGMYDECVSVEVEKNEELIRGRHCMYTLEIGVPTNNVLLSMTQSICLPASCGAEKVVETFQNAINIVSDFPNFEIVIQSATCSSVEAKPWTTGGIVTLVILGLFICFLVLCTIYDIYVRISSQRSDDSNLLNTFCKFSLYTNASRVLSTKVSPGTLPTIHGIRFFAMAWMILGHEYFLQLFDALVNQADIMPWLKSWNSIYITIAQFTVDTFFVLSGFLTSYLFMKEMQKGRKFNLALYYLHRYLRLTPALGAMILITIYITPRLGSGAIWDNTVEPYSNDCLKNWWPNLLYVQNFVRIDNAVIEIRNDINNSVLKRKCLQHIQIKIFLNR